MEKIGDGAEAIIYLDKNKVVKERIAKSYRLPEIDQKLRKYRTRKEAKLLQKLEKLGFTPKLIDSDDAKMTVAMQYIDAPRLRDVLTKTNHQKLCKEIGEKVAKLHNNHIVHSDLTTSNMILKDQIYFIDFGLSYESHKIEDKAVDLHLLKRALESKHNEIAKQAFKVVIQAYKQHANQAEDILKRFKTVELRGRYKTKS
ncbi:Kae1-associated serine/threonine protein kinase [Candidatus Woesearchaeota archaeon]|nr:Kae1-associated serine/threonine protein kinase [Candidatus Woesearchaeota archaeon]